MTKLKSIVASAINQKNRINKKASNFLVDNFKLDINQITTYGNSDYVVNRFKEQYPTVVDGGIDNVEGIMEWDIATTWTGLGFKFEPFVNYIKLSASVTIWFKDENGEETYTEEEIDLPVEDYAIKIKYEKTDEDSTVIEFKEIEVDLKDKEITVYFNV